MYVARRRPFCARGMPRFCEFWCTTRKPSRKSTKPFIALIIAVLGLTVYPDKHLNESYTAQKSKQWCVKERIPSTLKLIYFSETDSFARFVPTHWASRGSLTVSAQATNGP